MGPEYIIAGIYIFIPAVILPLILLFTDSP